MGTASGVQDPVRSMLYSVKIMRSPLLIFAAALYAQTVAVPRFEVASIKLMPSPHERAYARPVGQARNAARFQTYSNLRGLIGQAYRLEAYQNLVGPDWMEDEWFEVNAKLPESSNPDQIPVMLQTLLADRFRLAVRWESKIDPVYLLTVRQNGPRLKDADPDASVAQLTNRRDGRTVMMTARFSDGWLVYSRIKGMATLESNHITMRLLASILRSGVGLPAIDRTGLNGAYEISMPVPASMVRPAVPRPDGSSQEASDPAGVDIFQSVEMVGLHLEKGKAPINHLVVEHLEKVPAEN